MRLYFVQLGWEFYKLAARPRTWFAFGAIFAFEFVVSCLLRIGSVRARIVKDFWKMHLDFDASFSGLTTAAHVLGEAASILGPLGIGLVAADIVAKEAEDGTLHAIFGRPVSRARIFWQKLIVCTGYNVALMVFTAVGALLLGLLFEGRGPLLFYAPHEEVIGTFDYVEGVSRYWLALLLLIPAQFCGMIVCFAFSCCNVRPVAAVILGLTIFVGDTVIRTAPFFAVVRPWCLTTRLIAWRQVFNDEIPWTRIELCYRDLSVWALAWIALGYFALRRRDFMR